MLEQIEQFLLANPKLGIIIISLIVTLIMTTLTHFLTDKEFMRGVKIKQKAIKEEMKKHRDNPQKMMELNKQMMEDFPKQMMQSLKVSMITIIPFIILFNWLRKIFLATELGSGWIWWYLISSVIFSIILRKVFKLD